MSPPRQAMVAAALLLASACDGPDQPAAKTTAPVEPQPRVAAATADDPAPPDPTPRAKAYATTAEGTLGHLPDGVGIAVGETAPNPGLVDMEGRSLELHDLLEEGPILLVFYRGGWCPYCNFQIRELTTQFEEYRKLGIRPVAVSVDQPGSSAKTKAAYEIPFPVLSDSDLTAHRAFRVVNQLDQTAVERLKGFGLELADYSGRDHHVIAIPSLFVIDGEGKVRWAHADHDYKTRPSTPQLLAAIGKLDLTRVGRSRP